MSQELVEDSVLLNRNGYAANGRPEVVVLTGASAGLGRAIARAFAKQGAHIALLARGPDGLEATQEDVD